MDILVIFPFERFVSVGAPHRFRACQGHAAALAFAMLTTTSAIAGDLPDHRLTPGAIDPAVTQANVHETICSPGYSRSVRPPARYTSDLKRRQMAERRLPGRPGDYEEDHLISLEIGGSPTDPRNLWPQPEDGPWGAKTKDLLEHELHRRVCSAPGKPDHIWLQEAQAAEAANWVGAFKRYVCGRRLRLTERMLERC